MIPVAKLVHFQIIYILNLTLPSLISIQLSKGSDFLPSLTERYRTMILILRSLYIIYLRDPRLQSLKDPYLLFKGIAYPVLLSANDIKLTLEPEDGIIAQNADADPDFVDRPSEMPFLPANLL